MLVHSSVRDAGLAYSSSCSPIFLRTIWRIFIDFFGLLCFNNIASLTYDDVKWNATGFDLFNKKSKTD